MARCLPLAVLAGGAAGQTLYATDFTSSDGWWTGTSASGCGSAIDATPAGGCADPFVSPPSSLNFNNGTTFACGSNQMVAISPAIDLSQSASLMAELRFSALFDTGDPGWDNAWVSVRDAASGASRAYMAIPYGCVWNEYSVALDPTWGEVEIRFYTDWDGITFPGIGLFIDDLSVSGADPSFEINCVGDSSAVTGGRVYLFPFGSQHVADASFALAGAEFPTNSFAQAFYGASPGTITYASGTRCIAAPNSYRLHVLPTGAVGRPLWNLDLTHPAPFSTPILAGSTWYFQAIYRDRQTFRFSDSIGVTFE